MFSRLKGAIDSRIAEEQARQRQAQLGAQQSTRTPPRRRPQGQNTAPPRRPSRQREQANENTSTGKGPDPSEFEPEFAIGDDESSVPSRVATPIPEVKEKDRDHDHDGENDKENDKEKQPAPAAADETNEQHTSQDATTEKRPSDASTTLSPPSRSQDLPTDVRVKLRKLERMETRYGELLKAYRSAHARIQAVESFESTLRENTPLTSINDADALVEYLSQINLKSDMVLDELKRVTTDRDGIKKKLQASEDDATKLRDEVAVLKENSAPIEQPKPSPDPTQAISIPDPTIVAPTDTDTLNEPEATAKSPASTSSRIASFSLFSPRTKAVSPPPKETSEDLFSFDSEHARLESELQERQTEVEDLKQQVNNLKGDLKVARESTESMVQSLETATRELHMLREAKDKFDQLQMDLQAQIDNLEAKSKSDGDSSDRLKKDINNLNAQKAEATEQCHKLKKQIQDLETQNAELKQLSESRAKDATILNEKLAQKDSVVKDLEDTLAMYKAAERQEAKGKGNSQSSEKKLVTMQNIMDTLRGQLSTAESAVAELKAEVKTNKEEYSSRPSTKVFGFLDDSKKASIDSLNSREDVVNYLSENFGLQKTSTAKLATTMLTSSPAPSDAGTAASKKKNKKKKKGKGQQSAVEDAEVDTPVKVSENLADVDGGEASSVDGPHLQISKLESELLGLKQEIAAKDATIDRISEQLKDQESLQEEIETLRDDLLHQGEEHVEARDALKKVLSEKSTLQSSLDILEKALMEARKAAATGADSEKAHKQMVEQYDELQGRCTTLQKDLEAAEQLATARFKDITDLKDILAKAQPELRNLRSEVAELKSAKDDLKNKTGELNRLEARHEDLKSELKGLGKRLSDKDTEIKELQQKIDQETNNRTRIEKDLDKAQGDLKTAESRRQEASSSADQLSQNLVKAKEESTMLRAKLHDLDKQLSQQVREVSSLKEEVSLKTALHSSAQSLVQSLRDQTHELNMQARESVTRADNLEEELTEAQRMLSERTREGQTMRMLLDQSQSGTEARLREMKERMDAAIEERDRVEDEASVSNRRMMREVEEARSKARDAHRALKILEDEKDELETRQRDWKKRRDELEQATTAATREVEEVRSAMSGLREALDESERQVRELDTQKADLRRVGDDARERVEKLTKANKTLTEELKAAQSGIKNLRLPGRAGTGVDSGAPSSRTSIDSTTARSPAPKERSLLSSNNSRSETPTTTASGGLSKGTVDYVYLKNVLLQFLEQKDKGHQRQLIPVLGMLLHFDR
ncbi:uncharacterized protein A1O9_12271 [Exophiala aquamarina CBS 119918]|uniref:GRIP domain-containing protein n=1 Tax=Exophiala aquamarina CBS 119918 TaxID=1182545 RepID=A0A072NVK4_9EURO|nr:uncharacterized protein A1O9_12271 [Exophiala aquamarina CBS 119918]KEF51636.1 hypothetical protein A1O9_12271 [Exophiala aquamarina CBS 119918]